MYLRAIAVLGLLLGSAGCAKSVSVSEAPYEDYGYDEGMNASPGMPTMDMDMEMDVAPEPMADSRSSWRERRADRRASRRESGAGDSAGAGTAAPGPVPPPGGGGEAKPAPETEPDPPQDQARHIVYTATMQVSVFNLEDAKVRAESLPDRYGGFIQNMSSNYFVMRIPAVSLRPAMDELATLGVVDNRTLDAQDVTEEYLDIETRIAVLEATQKQMMELLTKAKNVEEALKVRQALDQITMELEVLKGRLRRLSNLVSFSTLTLNLVERGPHTPMPSSNDPFPWVDELGVEATEWK